MSWATERAQPGKKPWNWIEIELDRCTNVYGDAFASPTGLCEAVVGITGSDKCYNSWETCQDQGNYTKAPFWVRFCEPVDNIPLAFDFDNESPSEDGLDVFLPFLSDINHSPALPDPGESMGLRVQLTVTLNDAPHHDRGIDLYVDERSFDPMRRGTFFRKLKTRWPHYIGRRLRWYQGYITAASTIADFRKREYIMERFEGPDARGRVRIIAKDVLKLVDNDRAQAPRPSKGKLVLDMADTDTPSAFDVQTSDVTEYDLEGSPPPSEGYVRIGGEVFTYTGTALSSPDEGNVTLTGITRAAPSPYTTPLEDHDAGDLVQRCHYFSGTIPEVLYELLVDFGGISPAFIPFSDWATEAQTWLSGEDIQRLVCDPEGVQDLVNEIIGQTLSWGVWFDEVNQQIRWRAIRPADVTDTVVTINDDANIIADSISVVDEPSKVLNEVQALYGQIDPTKRADELENYRAGVAAVDADSQGENELNQRRIKRVFARWHPPANDAVILAWAQRTLSSRAKNLQTIEFMVDRKDEDINTADFADLTTGHIIDAFGLPREMRVQVLRVDSTGEQVKMRAREDFFKAAGFGRWGPDESPDILWETSTDSERETYIFWTDDDGNNGSTVSPTELVEGKRWL